MLSSLQIYGLTTPWILYVCVKILQNQKLESLYPQDPPTSAAVTDESP